PIQRFLPAVVPFFQRSEGCEGLSGSLAGARRVEHDTGFAWVRIDAEDEKLGCDCREIDRSIHQRLRYILEPNCNFLMPVPSVRGCRAENDINGLIDLVLHRLERDAAYLIDRSRHPADDMETAAAMARYIKARLEARQRRQIREPRNLAPHPFIGGKIEVQPALGHIGLHDRDPPWLPHLAVRRLRRRSVLLLTHGAPPVQDREKRCRRPQSRPVPPTAPTPDDYRPQALRRRPVSNRRETHCGRELRSLPRHPWLTEPPHTSLAARKTPLRCAASSAAPRGRLLPFRVCYHPYR